MSNIRHEVYAQLYDHVCHKLTPIVNEHARLNRTMLARVHNLYEDAISFYTGKCSTDSYNAAGRLIFANNNIRNIIHLHRLALGIEQAHGSALNLTYMMILDNMYLIRRTLLVNCNSASKFIGKGSSESRCVTTSMFHDNVQRLTVFDSENPFTAPLKMQRQLTAGQ